MSRKAARAMVAVLFVGLAGVRPVRAADDAQAVTPEVPRAAVRVDADLRGRRAEVTSTSRGTFLTSLYVSFTALQAYDGYATTAGLSHGATEANPLIGSAAGNPAVLWAVKGGTSAMSIFVAERLWRTHHRREAVVAMLAANGIAAAVAAHNASVLRAQR